MKAAAAAAVALTVVALGAGRSAAADQPGESIQPGQWEITMRADSFDMPGASAEELARFRSEMGRDDSRTICLTPERAPDPMRTLLGLDRSRPGQTCRTPENVFARGVIRLAMTCQRSEEAAASRQLSLIGRFAATSLTARISVSAEGPAAGSPGRRQTYRVLGSVTGRRLGDCPPGAPAPIPAPSN